MHQRGETFLQDEAVTVVERGFELRSFEKDTGLCCTGAREAGLWVAGASTGSGGETPQGVLSSGQVVSIPKYCCHFKG